MESGTHGLVAFEFDPIRWYQSQLPSPVALCPSVRLRDSLGIVVACFELRRSRQSCIPSGLHLSAGVGRVTKEQTFAEESVLSAQDSLGRS